MSINAGIRRALYYKALTVPALIGLCILCNSVANAQSIFITRDGTINTNVRGNDIFVGKDNLTDFNTLPGTITLNVANGAFISGANRSSPYYGLNVFGSHKINISGGVIEYAQSQDTSALDVSGGYVDNGITSYGSSAVNISGGTVNGFVGVYDSSTLNISDGTVNQVYSDNLSTVTISGGMMQEVESFGSSIMNITGGFISDYHSPYGGLVNAGDNSTLNISGGFSGAIGGSNSSTVNISGGGASHVYASDLTTLNISGGEVGGILDYLGDLEGKGIYFLGGTLDFQGRLFLLSDTVFGDYNGTKGTYSLLTGTLSDGSDLNTTLFIASGLHFEEQGRSQYLPFLPAANNNGTFVFNNIPSGAWVDPPLVGAYDFAMTGGDFFTSILDFPSGIGDADGLFTVSVGGVALGQFSSGTAVNFANFGFAGGVSGFTISGIDPTVDGANPTAFPIKLGFSSASASFTMTGITGAAAPEPATLLLVLPVLGIAALRRKRA